MKRNLEKFTYLGLREMLEEEELPKIGDIFYLKNHDKKYNIVVEKIQPSKKQVMKRKHVVIEEIDGEVDVIFRYQMGRQKITIHNVKIKEK